MANNDRPVPARVRAMRADRVKRMMVASGLDGKTSTCAELVHVTPRTWQRYASGEKLMPESAVHLFCLLVGREHDGRQYPGRPVRYLDFVGSVWNALEAR